MIQSNNGDLVGKVLGACTLEQQIGRGGMSVVYLAQQTRPYRKVAVKILLPNVPTNSQVHDEFLARFLREADVIARLEHNNIVRIYECDLQDGLAYLVMPYLAGGNLAHLLTQLGTLTLQEASKYVTEAAAALDYAHSQGIIHRDLKPSNFLLQADGHLVLADFGIAYMMRDRNSPRRATLTISGTVLGTPDYMAPEMMLGRDIDYRVDIYELGIVLYQMLSGDVPFKGRTSIETMLKHSEEPLPHLHHRHPSIPPAVDAVIQKAAAKDRADRYTSAGELAQALERAIQEPRYPTSHYTPTILVLSPPTRPLNPTLPVYPSNMMGSSNGHAAVAPQQPVQKEKRSSTGRSWKSFSLGFILVAFTAGMIFVGVRLGLAESGALSTSLQHQSGLTQDAQQAQQTVQDYYGNINQRNYQKAHQMLSTDNSTAAYCHFVNDFAQTDFDKVSFDGTPQQIGNVYRVPITLQASEETSSGTWQTTYQGYQTVKKVNNTWMIVGGNLKFSGRTAVADPTPNAVPAQEGQAIMQQYYDDINHQDYPAAYKLWGTIFHSSTDYCSFVTDYRQTQHDAVAFSAITQQNDGTVLVPMTILATEQTASGTQKTTYQAIYTVGLENGQWKILKGQMRKING